MTVQLTNGLNDLLNLQLTGLTDLLTLSDRLTDELIHCLPLLLFSQPFSLAFLVQHIQQVRQTQPKGLTPCTH